MPKLTLVLLSGCLFTTSAAAQSRLELGIFLDWLSISQTGTSDFGLGARFGYRVHRDVMLEAELAYDYGLNFDESFRDITTETSRPLNALRSV